MRLFGTRLKPAEKTEEDRQKAIAYKKVFAGEDGRLVLFDLCNRYHVLDCREHEKFQEGQRSVAVDILTRCNVDLVQFDKMLRGELA